MGSSEVKVGFRKMGDRIIPVSLQVDRYGIYPDEKGNLPSLTDLDGEMLEDLLSTLLGLDVASDAQAEKSITEDMQKQFHKGWEGLSDGVATFAKAVAEIQKQTGYSKENAGHLVGAMMNKLRSKKKD